MLFILIIQSILLILKTFNILTASWLVILLPTFIELTKVTTMFIIYYLGIYIDKLIKKETNIEINSIKETCYEIKKKYIPKTIYTKIKPINYNYINTHTKIKKKK